MKQRALGMALIITWCMTLPLRADSVTERSLTLQFVPQESTGSSAPTLAGGMANRAVAVTFEDVRPPSEAAAVGEGTDDHDHLFPWHSTNSVMEFATEVFHRTSVAWGIQESAGADLTLALRITRFFVTEKDQAVGSTYAAEVRIGFALKDRAGAVLADGASAGSARRYGRKRSGENCNEVLSDAIKEAYANLFDNPNLQAAWSGKRPTSTSRSNDAAPPAAGTAWFVGHRWLVTANHVVEGHSSLSIVLEGGTQLPVRAITRDAANDVAILELDADPPTTTGCLVLSSGGLMMGQSVFTVGFPHPDIMGTGPKLTTGEISAEQGLMDDPRLYQISVPVQMGNSGGPLLGTRGDVAGLIVGKLSPLVMLRTTGDLPENVNYALKADYIRPLLRGLSLCQSPRPQPAQGETDLSAVAGRVRHAVVIVIAN
ncbi:MAG TPA: serine protease [Candidatus Dormibacteraeota bacterium]|nr:serine protease [Candidatus Dormibacteraeota bacterium]